MRNNIAILGSSGSIGKTLLQLIRNKKKNFNIHVLTADKNYKLLFKQAKEFNLKNLIIRNKESYEILKSKTINTDIRVYQNFESFNNIFKKKIDYVMSAITGLDGLEPTLKIIKYTNKIAIANKETIICAWNLIKNELKKNKTFFIPVDSEHFSLWYALKNLPSDKIEKIYLTASGGPFLNLNKKKLNKITFMIKYLLKKFDTVIVFDGKTISYLLIFIIRAKNKFAFIYKKKGFYNSIILEIFKFLLKLFKKRGIIYN